MFKRSVLLLAGLMIACLAIVSSQSSANAQTTREQAWLFCNPEMYAELAASEEAWVCLDRAQTRSEREACTSPLQAHPDSVLMLYRDTPDTLRVAVSAWFGTSFHNCSFSGTAQRFGGNWVAVDRNGCRAVITLLPDQVSVALEQPEGCLICGARAALDRVYAYRSGRNFLEAAPEFIDEVEAASNMCVSTTR